MRRIITIEEHLAGVPIGRVLGNYAADDAPYSALAHKDNRPYCADWDIFGDMDNLRLQDMDKNGISMQILSCPAKSQLIPPIEAPSAVRESNNYIEGVFKKHPDRYGAFGMLPWSNPEESAKEAQRIKSSGFYGVLIAGRATGGNEFLDSKKFYPILEACEALELPIYIHPGAPLRSVQEPYYGGLGDELSARLSLHGWGWHNEAGIQVIRMILSGVFERFPKLQIIAGHWGEMVPFFLSRLDQSMPQTVTKLSRTVSETFRQNVYVTPSGIFDYPQLKFCAEVLGADRIIHSVDCPFISNEGALPFIENAPLSEEDKDKIAYLNAKKLFGIKY